MMSQMYTLKQILSRKNKNHCISKESDERKYTVSFSTTASRATGDVPKCTWVPTDIGMMTSDTVLKLVSTHRPVKVSYYYTTTTAITIRPFTITTLLLLLLELLLLGYYYLYCYYHY